MGLRILISAVLLSWVTMHINGQIAKIRITTCNETRCPSNQECRIVVESNELIEPRCLDPPKILESGKNPCGSSGHSMVKKKTKGNKELYKPFLCSLCPSVDLVLNKKKKLCCADTSKPGECPPLRLNKPCGTITGCTGDNECPGKQKCCQCEDKHSCMYYTQDLS
ncbi:uncharacterized protein LOC143298318 [Babylonia areolata]|uniref:uncharacterized protein LOC143298318 n=1 Tax=Babylonia areolata TaxID=304850 RepID=UPI003FCEEFFA